MCRGWGGHHDGQQLQGDVSVLLQDVRDPTEVSIPRAPEFLTRAYPRAQAREAATQASQPTHKARDLTVVRSSARPGHRRATAAGEKQDGPPSDRPDLTRTGPSSSGDGGASPFRLGGTWRGAPETRAHLRRRRRDPSNPVRLIAPSYEEAPASDRHPDPRAARGGEPPS